MCCTGHSAGDMIWLSRAFISGGFKSKSEGVVPPLKPLSFHNDSTEEATERADSVYAELFKLERGN